MSSERADRIVWYDGEGNSVAAPSGKPQIGYEKRSRRPDYGEVGWGFGRPSQPPQRPAPAPGEDGGRPVSRRVLFSVLIASVLILGFAVALPQAFTPPPQTSDGGQYGGMGGGGMMGGGMMGGGSGGMMGGNMTGGGMMEGCTEMMRSHMGNSTMAEHMGWGSGNYTGGGDLGRGDSRGAGGDGGAGTPTSLPRSGSEGSGRGGMMGVGGAGSGGHMGGARRP